MTTRIPHLVLIALVFLVSPAHAQLREWAYAMTDDLTVTPIRFDHIDSTTGIFGTDELKLDRRFTPDSLLAVWFDGSTGSTLFEGMDAYKNSTLVELTDGQRLRLTIEESTIADTLIATRYDGGNRVAIPIDRIRSLTRKNQNDALPSSDGDTILLTNNDQLTGFILDIAPIVQIETNTGVAHIPLDQIAGLTIQNPSVHTPGTYIHTALSERLRVSWFAASENLELAITLDDPMYTESTETESTIGAGLIAVEYKRADLHLVNPTLNKPLSTTPTGGRQWAPQPTIKKTKYSRWTGTERTTIFIPSPTAIRWPLPQNAKRFSAWVSTKNESWTDNETSIIAITNDGTEHTLWSQRMTAASPRYDLLLDLPPQSIALEVRIDPGNRGPIQDGVWISSPRILVTGSPQFE